jgi:hypothetical protein
MTINASIASREKTFRVTKFVRPKSRDGEFVCFLLGDSSGHNDCLVR